MSRGTIILLTGVDGSGKSTLARVVQGQLQTRGRRTVVVWAGLRPILLKPFILAAKFLLVRKHDKFADYDRHIQAKKAGMNRLRFAHSIYFFVMMLDYLPQVFFKVTLPRLLGRIVICDRYYHDLMLDYVATVSGSFERLTGAMRLADRLFSRPALMYFVSIPSEVAKSRKTDIPSVEYLEERRRYYDHLVAQCGITVLDGTQSLEANSSRIISDLDRLAKTP